MNYVERFLKSAWLKRGTRTATSTLRSKALLFQVGFYLSRRGVSHVKEDLTLMYRYLRDVVSGAYKEFDRKSMVLVVAALAYLVSPLDFLPDIIPGGLIDDVAIIAWAFKEVAKELERYRLKALGTDDKDKAHPLVNK
ncbi:MAG: DUF1232 domain-containing protein [Bacteroides sp.]|nr:DUF1232 domain-containing protein [Bacteroides sp.]